jgi:integrase
MTWVEIDGTDWVLPATRNKTRVELVRPLSKAACDLLDKLPRDSAYVFAGRRNAINSESRSKRRLDLDSGVTGWRLHDLRRTARSLMSRAGVPSDHAERCLGTSSAASAGRMTGTGIMPRRKQHSRPWHARSPRSPIKPEIDISAAIGKPQRESKDTHAGGRSRAVMLRSALPPKADMARVYEYRR